MKNIIKKIFLAAIFCMGALSFADGTAAKKIKIWKEFLLVENLVKL